MLLEIVSETLTWWIERLICFIQMIMLILQYQGRNFLEIIFVNIKSIYKNHARIRNSAANQQLKADLVEEIWNRFERENID